MGITGGLQEIWEAREGGGYSDWAERSKRGKTLHKGKITRVIEAPKGEGLVKNERSLAMPGGRKRAPSANRR